MDKNKAEGATGTNNIANQNQSNIFWYYTTNEAYSNNITPYMIVVAQPSDNSAEYATSDTASLNPSNIPNVINEQPQLVQNINATTFADKSHITDMQTLKSQGSSSAKSDTQREHQSLRTDIHILENQGSLGPQPSEQNRVNHFHRAKTLISKCKEPVDVNPNRQNEHHQSHRADVPRSKSVGSAGVKTNNQNQHQSHRKNVPILTAQKSSGVNTNSQNKHLQSHTKNVQILENQRYLVVNPKDQNGHYQSQKANVQTLKTKESLGVKPNDQNRHSQSHRTDMQILEGQGSLGTTANDQNRHHHSHSLDMPILDGYSEIQPNDQTRHHQGQITDVQKPKNMESSSVNLNDQNQHHSSHRKKVKTSKAKESLKEQPNKHNHTTPTTDIQISKSTKSSGVKPNDQNRLKQSRRTGVNVLKSKRSSGVNTNSRIRHHHSQRRCECCKTDAQTRESQESVNLNLQNKNNSEIMKQMNPASINSSNQGNATQSLPSTSNTVCDHSHELFAGCAISGEMTAAKELEREYNVKLILLKNFLISGSNSADGPAAYVTLDIFAALCDTHYIEELTPEEAGYLVNVLFNRLLIPNLGPHEKLLEQILRAIDRLRSLHTDVWIEHLTAAIKSLAYNSWISVIPTILTTFLNIYFGHLSNSQLLQLIMALKDAFDGLPIRMLRSSLKHAIINCVRCIRIRAGQQRFRNVISSLPDEIFKEFYVMIIIQ